MGGTAQDISNKTSFLVVDFCWCIGAPRINLRQAN
jgi:hypothetical protein